MCQRTPEDAWIHSGQPSYCLVPKFDALTSFVALSTFQNKNRHGWDWKRSGWSGVRGGSCSCSAIFAWLCFYQNVLLNRKAQCWSIRLAGTFGERSVWYLLLQRKSPTSTVSSHRVLPSALRPLTISKFLSPTVFDSSWRPNAIQASFHSQPSLASRASYLRMPYLLIAHLHSDSQQRSSYQTLCDGLTNRAGMAPQSTAHAAPATGTATAGVDRQLAPGQQRRLPTRLSRPTTRTWWRRPFTLERRILAV